MYEVYICTDMQISRNNTTNSTAAKWEQFHAKQKNGEAYKLRNYLVKASPFLSHLLESEKGELNMLEVGCGIGIAFDEII
jgi:hypothetical protein